MTVATSVLSIGIVVVGVIASGAIAMTMKNPTIDWPAAKASSKESMTAVSYDQHGSVEVLKYHKNSYPKPIPKDNQVLIQVKASSINPVDFKFRRNPVPDLLLPKPKIPGADVAGVVAQVGSQVSSFQQGDRVAAMMPLMGGPWGANAEYVAVDASLVATISEKVDYKDAASLPLVSLTVMQALNLLESSSSSSDDKSMEPEKKILIHAGAGGVGTFAIQYAKNVLGMYVATTASSQKAKFLKGLGADLVIDYRTQDFTTVVQDYDIVLDTMSFLYETKTLQSNVLKPNGHYINIMSSDWALVEGKEKSYGPATLLNSFKHKATNLIVGGILPKYDFFWVNPNGDDLQMVMNLLESGKIKAVIDSVFPLVKLADAHLHLEGGHVSGKVVIQH